MPDWNDAKYRTPKEKQKKQKQTEEKERMKCDRCGKPFYVGLEVHCQCFWRIDAELES